LLPKLFKKAVVYGTKPMFVPQDISEEEAEVLRKQFEDELNALTFAADKKCGLPEVHPGLTPKKDRHQHHGRGK